MLGCTFAGVMELYCRAIVDFAMDDHRQLRKNKDGSDLYKLGGLAVKAP